MLGTNGRGTMAGVTDDGPMPWRRLERERERCGGDLPIASSNVAGN